VSLSPLPGVYAEVPPAGVALGDRRVCWVGLCSLRPRSTYRQQRFFFVLKFFLPQYIHMRFRSIPLEGVTKGFSEMVFGRASEGHCERGCACITAENMPIAPAVRRPSPIVGVRRAIGKNTVDDRSAPQACLCIEVLCARFKRRHYRNMSVAPIVRRPSLTAGVGTAIGQYSRRSIGTRYKFL